MTPRSVVACPYCAWTKTYAWPSGASLGRTNHMRATHPGEPIPRRRRPRRPRRPPSTALGDHLDAAARADSDAAGYPQRSEAEWRDHPDALEELARVVTGTSLTVLAQERMRDRLLLVEYRRLLNARALAARLKARRRQKET